MNATPEAGDRCGTTSGYRLGCRCNPCRAAKKSSAGGYYAANQEKIAESRRTYYAANRDARVDYSRRYRAKDPLAVKEQGRRYREANPEKVAEAQRRWRTNNSARIAEARRRWYLEHQAAEAEYARRYRAENPERFRAESHRRRARLFDAFVEDVDRLIVFDADGWICQKCRIECPKSAVFPARNFATLDHIVPLSKGGEHSYANTQTLCFSCNCSKRDR